MVVKKVHEAFNMTVEGGDIEALSNFALQFYMKHFDHEEKSIDEYPKLRNSVDWDFAVLDELAKFKEIEGTSIQCSYLMFFQNKEFEKFGFGILEFNVVRRYEAICRKQV